MACPHAELIDRYCDVWSEPDEASRAEKLAAVWSKGAIYVDPGVHAEGAAELLAHIAGVQAKRPGSRVERTSGLDLHHGIGHFAWRAVGVDGAVLREGIDVAFFDADGSRIERIVGFFAPFAAREA